MDVVQKRRLCAVLLSSAVSVSPNARNRLHRPLTRFQTASPANPLLGAQELSDQVNQHTLKTLGHPGSCGMLLPPKYIDVRILMEGHMNT
jgi:hypothetical protein